MSYRSDVDALAARHQSLNEDVARVRRERDETAAKLARLRLPVLDNIRVASPCKESWHDMTGDARVRHCVRCDQNVYNLSDMTREEAEALILAKEGKLCVRYFRRKLDGTILVKKDCPVGAQRRKRWWVGLGVAATLIGAITGLLRRGDTIAPPPPGHEEIAGGMEPMMGEVAAPQQPAPDLAGLAAQAARGALR